MEIWATLFSIAASIGLDKAILYLNTIKNKENGLSADDIIKAITMMTNAARAKGQNVLNNLNDKILAMTLPYGVSADVKDVIMKKKREAAAQLRKTREDIANVEAKLTTLDNRASAYASLPEETRGTLSDIKDRIVTDAAEAVGDMNKIQEGVEKHV